MVDWLFLPILDIDMAVSFVRLSFQSDLCPAGTLSPALALHGFKKGVSGLYPKPESLANPFHLCAPLCRPRQ